METYTFWLVVGHRGPMRRPVVHRETVELPTDATESQVAEAFDQWLARNAWRATASQ